MLISVKLRNVTQFFGHTVSSGFQKAGNTPDIELTRTDLETGATPDTDLVINSNTSTPLGYHDIVKIVSGPFLGYYAVVTDKDIKNHDKDEIIINYLRESGDKLTLIPNHLDSRPVKDMEKITAKIDGTSRYFVAYLE